MELNSVVDAKFKADKERAMAQFGEFLYREASASYSALIPQYAGGPHWTVQEDAELQAEGKYACILDQGQEIWEKNRGARFLWRLFPMVYRCLPTDLFSWANQIDVDTSKNVDVETARHGSQRNIIWSNGFCHALTTFTMHGFWTYKREWDFPIMAQLMQLAVICRTNDCRPWHLVNHTEDTFFTELATEIQNQKAGVRMIKDVVGAVEARTLVVGIPGPYKVTVEDLASLVGIMNRVGPSTERAGMPIGWSAETWKSIMEKSWAHDNRQEPQPNRANGMLLARAIISLVEHRCRCGNGLGLAKATRKKKAPIKIIYIGNTAIETEQVVECCPKRPRCKDQYGIFPDDENRATSIAFSQARKFLTASTALYENIIVLVDSTYLETMDTKIGTALINQSINPTSCVKIINLYSDDWDDKKAAEAVSLFSSLFREVGIKKLPVSFGQSGNPGPDLEPTLVDQSRLIDAMVEVLLKAVSSGVSFELAVLVASARHCVKHKRSMQLLIRLAVLGSRATQFLSRLDPEYVDEGIQTPSWLWLQEARQHMAGPARGEMSAGRLWFALGIWDKMRKDTNNFSTDMPQNDDELGHADGLEAHPELVSEKL
ncbi:hypothetical protein SLS64_007511 [Diaporthe eres]